MSFPFSVGKSTKTVFKIKILNKQEDNSKGNNITIHNITVILLTGKGKDEGGEMELRVWHIPQVPMKAFHVEVLSIDEAWKILNVLWNYDLFQYENKVKPDYCNMSGLEYFDEEENDWLEWEDGDGYDIKEHFENLKITMNNLVQRFPLNILK